MTIAPGEVVMLETGSGPQLAVWIRTNRNGREVVRRVYYAVGADLTVDVKALTPLRKPEHYQNVADAIASVLVEDQRRRA